MKLVVGLGNPGSEYRVTFHNVGFWSLDLFLAKHRKKTTHRKHGGLYTRAELSGEEWYFLKPLCFMNRSGECVAPFARDLGLDAGDLLILHDEADFGPGRIQLKRGGSSGGHNGLESIIARLGSNDFWRLRVGIGKDPGKLLADYVLEEIPEEAVRPLGEHGAEALDEVVTHGFEAAMQTINSPKFQQVSEDAEGLQTPG
ncbi:MAG: aminoacyl-tRNA hydrolase [Pseudomonadota bacterium]